MYRPRLAALLLLGAALAAPATLLSPAPAVAAVPDAPHCSTSGTWRQGELNVYWFDVEQGDSQLVVGPTGKTLLVDLGETAWNSTGGGTEATAVAAQVRNICGVASGPVHLDYVMASHHHLDHIGYPGNPNDAPRHTATASTSCSRRPRSAVWASPSARSWTTTAVSGPTATATRTATWAPRRRPAPRPRGTTSAPPRRRPSAGSAGCTARADRLTGPTSTARSCASRTPRPGPPSTSAPASPRRSSRRTARTSCRPTASPRSAATTAPTPAAERERLLHGAQDHVRALRLRHRRRQRRRVRHLGQRLHLQQRRGTAAHEDRQGRRPSGPTTTARATPRRAPTSTPPGPADQRDLVRRRTPSATPATASSTPTGPIGGRHLPHQQPVRHRRRQRRPHRLRGHLQLIRDGPPRHHRCRGAGYTVDYDTGTRTYVTRRRRRGQR